MIHYLLNIEAAGNDSEKNTTILWGSNLLLIPLGNLKTAINLKILNKNT